jgi:cytoskeletal protein RodZ
MMGRREPPSKDEVEKPLGFDDFDLRLGDLMRGERATIGKSLLDVQRELKIRASYIAAIENCDVAAFETPGFIAGYVRSYARYLGMDPEWAYSRFCEEANFSVAHGMSAESRQRKPAAPSRPRKEYVDPLANPNATFLPKQESWFARIEPGAIGSMAVLVALIAVIGYGGMSVLREVQRVQLAPVDQAPGVIADLDPLDGVAPLPEAPGSGFDVAGGAPGVAAPGTDSLDRLYRPQALDLPVMVSRDGPIAAITPERVADAAPGPAATTPVPQPQETPVQVVAEGPPMVEILAVRPAWVRVQAADGTVLFEKILDAGERYQVPQTEEPARLRAGNSGSVYFLVNGETFGPAAPGANVASNVNLSAGALRDTFDTADLTRDPDLARMVDVARAGQ